MLEHMYIQNLGLVDTLHIDFHKEITMFTGETGAGKSMLLSSLLLLMGGKVNTSTVKVGKEQAIITSVWNIAGQTELHAWLSAHGIDASDDELHIRRVIKANKRSQCFIQGQSITIQEMAKCLSLLCEVHTQHENQSLFKATTQLAILDAYAGLTQRVNSFIERFQQYNTQEALYHQHINDAQQRAREIDYLKYAIEEIERINMRVGEDDNVMTEIKTTSNIEQLTTHWNALLELLEGEQGVRNNLFEAIKILSHISDIQSPIASIGVRVDSLMIEIEDILGELHKEHNTMEYVDPDRLKELELRLLDIETLKKKYGDTIQKVLHFKEEAQQKVQFMEDYEHTAGHTAEMLAKEKEALIQEAGEISTLRKMSAEQFSQDINDILDKLAMGSSIFSVSFEEQKLGTQGIDKVLFLIATNKGNSLFPLTNIVSGGELSRVMLAIKVVSAQYGEVPTLVLDEIDAGIGGKTARVLSEYLFQLGRQVQIICVTHLPIIAACGRIHYLVKKTEHDDEHSVTISELSQDARVKELSRMLTGNEDEILSQTQVQQFLDMYT